MRKSYHIAIILPCLIGTAAGMWTSISFWYDLKEGLIAFLGLIAASLIQVMPITANFLQSDRLSPADAVRLSKSLKRQQHYWIGLLSAVLLAFCVVVVISALKSRLDELPILIRSTWVLSLSWEQIFCFLAAASIAFVLLRIKNLFSGILSLHDLRAEIVLSAAQERSREQRRAELQGVDEISAEVRLPPQYGRVVSRSVGKVEPGP